MNTTNTSAGTVIANAARGNKTIADPCTEFETMLPLWKRSRAVCGGERHVKAVDRRVDKWNFNNLLIPFSSSMTDAQYLFYKSEAELPGIVAQFSRMLVGGLLRKQPTLELPDEVPEDAHDWILNDFGQDGSSMAAVLDSALWEELQTARSWLYIDHPVIDDADLATMDAEDKLKYKPYPVEWKAESIINWRVSIDKFGKKQLSQILVSSFEPVYKSDEDETIDEFHPKFIATIRVHELDKNGEYQIRVFQEKTETTNIPVVQGKKQQQSQAARKFELVGTITEIFSNDKRLTIIPAWPLNGNIETSESILGPLVDKEVALYNKVSRRNHLLYGAATYTPYVIGDMVDEDFEAIVNKGLGSWLKLPSGSSIDVLKTPTEALADYDRTIAAAIEEMAKLGVRMLSPETDQSGVALEIRNAAQTAQLGTLNNKISNTMKQIIAFMLNWRYDLNLKASDIKFSLSSDFSPVPLGADWLRLATEWYQQGLIPRSVWLMMLKLNDMIPPEYDDVAGQKEIDEYVELINKKQSSAYAEELAAQAAFESQTGDSKETDKNKLKVVK